MMDEKKDDWWNIVNDEYNKIKDMYSRDVFNQLVREATENYRLNKEK